MNKITEQATRAASKNNPGFAKKASAGYSDYHTERFDYQVQDEWWGLIMNQVGVYVRHRAEHLTKLRHPEIFDDDGLIDDHYYDVACFSRMVNRAIDRHIDNHPELKLESYDSLLRQLHPKQLELF